MNYKTEDKLLKILASIVKTTLNREFNT